MVQQLPAKTAVPPCETSPEARSEEKRLFSQASIAVAPQNSPLSLHSAQKSRDLKPPTLTTTTRDGKTVPGSFVVEKAIIKYGCYDHTNLELAPPS